MRALVKDHFPLLKLTAKATDIISDRSYGCINSAVLPSIHCHHDCRPCPAC